MNPIRYRDHTDSVPDKLKLLEAAYAAGRFDVAMSLAASLKETLDFERHASATLPEPAIAADHFLAVDDLPKPWSAWAEGWKYVKPLTLFETIDLARRAEPVDLAIAFRADQCDDLGAKCAWPASIRVRACYRKWPARCTTRAAAATSATASSSSRPTSLPTSKPTISFSTAICWPSGPTTRPTCASSAKAPRWTSKTNTFWRSCRTRWASSSGSPASASMDSSCTPAARGTASLPASTGPTTTSTRGNCKNCGCATGRPAPMPTSCAGRCARGFAAGAFPTARSIRCSPRRASTWTRRTSSTPACPTSSSRGVSTSSRT